MKLIGNIRITCAVAMDVRRIFSFPDPVNETSARLVAAGVVAQAVVFVVVREGWLLVPLVYGFLARVLTGPTLSPLGQLATRVGTPWLENSFGVRSRLVPGTPKRFAQSVGLGFSAVAAIAWFLGSPGIAFGVLTLLVIAATLESAAAVCLGCIGYNAIWGCVDCDDITDRLRTALAESNRSVEPASSATATR
jgi:hypothetical protein